MSDHISGPRAIPDPVTDVTDVFAFPCPKSPRHLVLITGGGPGRILDCGSSRRRRPRRGGRRAPLGNHLTVVVEPLAQAKLSREEVFGPVACVYGFTNLDEAIEIANSLPFAFQASIFGYRPRAPGS
jgi:hypothetical protein